MTNKYILPSIKEAKKRTREETIINHQKFEIPQYIQDIGNGRYFYIRTYGCQANERDSETIAGIFKELGFQEAIDYSEADVILLNTCAIRENAEDKVFGELGFLKRLKTNNPDLLLGVSGCMVQQESVINKILQSYQHVDFIFGTHNIHNLPTILYQALIAKEKMIEVYSKEGSIIENLPVNRFGNHKAWVNIIYGCDKFCTYCIVPFTRGKERSRLEADILNEVNELIAEGYQEITLLGQNVNAYGKDIDYPGGFAGLLEAVALTNVERIRFTTSHPWDFSDEMIDVISKYPNIMPSFHLPVQSGDNNILKLMGRRYTIDDYKSIYDKLANKLPHCSFTTDIIVGFPNETEEQFQKTLDLYDYCQFDSAFTFIYSPRSNTPAAKMIDNVPLEVKKERLQRLNKKVGYYAKKKNEAYLNKVVQVLVDGPSKKNPNIYSGYTETNKLVNFSLKTGQVGDIISVQINETKSWSLNGEEI